MKDGHIPVCIGLLWKSSWRSLAVTVLLEMMVWGFIALGIHGLLERVGVIGLRAGVVPEEPKSPQQLRRQAKRILHVGLVLVVLVSVAAAAGKMYVENLLMTPLAVGTALEPQSLLVETKAVMHPNLAVKYITQRGGTIESTVYFVPVTSEEWKEGDPVQYFVKTEITGFPNGKGGFYYIKPDQPPFPVQGDFYINKNSLGGVKDRYRENHIKVQDPHYVLTKTVPTFSLRYITWIWGVAVIIIFIGTVSCAVGMFLRARRLEQEQREANQSGGKG